MIDETRIRNVAQQALALDEPRRSTFITTFLEAECAADPAMREHIEAVMAGMAEARHAGLEGCAGLEDAAPRPPGQGLAEGVMLAHFRLTRKLGEGGMGEVWAAEDTKLDRHVALKLIRPELLDSERVRKQFHREAKAISRLNHPNITTIFEIGSWQGGDFLVFEHLEGGQLLDRMTAQGPMAEQDIVDIALPLANAIAYAHECGIIHMDIMPSNVMFTRAGIPKLLDFGLAKALDAKSTLMNVGVVGTPAYMSPEQARGESLDEGTDIYSFGAALFHMTTGRPPYEGKSAAAVLQAVRKGDHPALARLRPSLSTGCCDLVEACMADDHSRRSPDMQTVITRLQALRPPPPKTLASKVQIGALAGLLLALVAVFVWQLWTSGYDDSDVTLAVPTFVDERDDKSSPQALQLADAIVRTLGSADGLHFVPFQYLDDLAHRENVPTAGLVALPALLESTGADAVVHGKILAAAGQLFVDVQLRDTLTGRITKLDTLQAPVDWEARAPMAVQWAGKIGSGILEILHRDPTSLASEASILADLTTDDAAYGFFVAGQESLVRADYRTAASQLTLAVERDPDFHLARLRLSTAARYSGQEDLAVTTALEGVDRLAGVDSTFASVVRANALYLRGKYTQAHKILKAAEARDADDPEVLYLLGEIYSHWSTHPAPQLATLYMQRALDAHSQYRDHHHVINHIVLAHAFQGQLAEAQKLLDDWRQSSGGNRTRISELMLQAMRGRSAEALASLDRDEYQSQNRLLMEGIVVLAGNWELAEDLTAGDLWASPTYGMWATRNRGDLLAYQGHLNEAVQAYESVIEHARTTGYVEDESFRGGIPVTCVHAICQTLAWQGREAQAAERAQDALVFQPTGLRSLFVAGSYLARAGRLDECEEILRRLRAVTKEGLPLSGRIASVYEDALAAELELARDHPEQALSLLVPWLQSPGVSFDWYTNESSVEGALWDAARRAHSKLGDRAGEMSALRDLLHSGYGRLSQPVAYVQALLDLGLMLEADGREAEGHEYLDQYLALWGANPPRPEDAARAREVLAASGR